MGVFCVFLFLFVFYFKEQVFKDVQNEIMK